MRTVALLIVVAVWLAACSALPGGSGNSTALHVDVQHQAGRTVLRSGRPLRVRFEEFVDARAVTGPRVGGIRATVRDMHGTELLLDRSVAALLTETARAQLAADGMQTVEAGAATDVVIGGTIRAFALDITGRDERAMAVEITVRDGTDQRLIWAGVIADQDDRYAGVAGNSRASIAAYLTEGVTTFAGRFSAAVREALLKAYPDSVELAPAKADPAIPGVVTLSSAEPPPAAKVSPAVVATASAPAAATGVLSIRTSPPRAKVYVGEVYYGLSPLRFDLPAGVAVLSVHLGGHQSVREKVSVRAGQETELELDLHRQ